MQNTNDFLNVCEGEVQTSHTGERFQYESEDDFAPASTMVDENGDFYPPTDFCFFELELPWYGNVPVTLTMLNSFSESNTKTVEGKMEDIEDLFDCLYQANESVESQSQQPQGDYYDYPCYKFEEDSDPETITDKDFNEQFRFQSGYDIVYHNHIQEGDNPASTLFEELVEEKKSGNQFLFDPDYFTDNEVNVLIASDSEEEEDEERRSESFATAIGESSSSSEEECLEPVMISKVCRKMRPRRLPRAEKRKIQEEFITDAALPKNANKRQAWSRALGPNDKYRQNTFCGPPILRKIELDVSKLRKCKILYPYLCTGDFDLETLIHGFRAVTKMLFELQWYKKQIGDMSEKSLQADVLRKLFLVCNYNRLQRLDGKQRKPVPLKNTAMFYWLANYKFFLHCFSDKTEDVFSQRWDLFYKDSENYNEIRSEVKFQGFGDAWQWVKDKVAGATASVQGLGSDLVSDAIKKALKGLPETIWTGLKNAAMATADYIKTVFQALAANIKIALDKCVDVLKIIFEPIFKHKMARQIIQHSCVALALILLFTIVQRYLTDDLYRTLFFALFCTLGTLYGLSQSKESMACFNRIWNSCGALRFQADSHTLKAIFMMVASFFVPRGLSDWMSVTTRWNDFTGSLQDHFKWLVDNVYRFFAGVHYYPEYEDKDKFKEFMLKVSEVLETEDPDTDAGFDATTCAKIHELQLQVAKQRMILAKMYKHTNPTYITLSKALDNLTVLYQKSLSQSVDVRDRITPFVIWLDGPAGQGKSDAAKLLPKAIYDNVKSKLPQHFLREWNDAMTYCKPQSSDYWELYNPFNHFAVAIEEVASQADSKTRGKFFAEFLELVSTGPKPLDSAAISGKGATFFGSKLIIMSTNITDFDIRSGGGTTEPPAIFRRRHLKLHVLRGKDFEDEAERIDHRNEAWKFTIEKTECYEMAYKWSPDLISAIERGETPTITFDQIVALASAQIVERIVKRDQAALKRKKTDLLVSPFTFGNKILFDDNGAGVGDLASEEESSGPRGYFPMGPKALKTDSNGKFVVPIQVVDTPGYDTRAQFTDVPETMTPEEETHSDEFVPVMDIQFKGKIFAFDAFFSINRFDSKGFDIDSIKEESVQKFALLLSQFELSKALVCLNPKVRKIPIPSATEKLWLQRLERTMKKMIYYETKTSRTCLDAYLEDLTKRDVEWEFASMYTDPSFLMSIRSELYMYWIRENKFPEHFEVLKFQVRDEIPQLDGRTEREIMIMAQCGRFPPRFAEMHSSSWWSSWYSSEFEGKPDWKGIVDLLNPVEFDMYYQDRQEMEQIRLLHVEDVYDLDKYREYFAQVFSPKRDERIRAYRFLMKWCYDRKFSKDNPLLQTVTYNRNKACASLFAFILNTPYGTHPLFQVMDQVLRAGPKFIFKPGRMIDGSEAKDIKNIFIECAVKGEDPITRLEKFIGEPNQSMLRTILEDLEYHMERKGATYYAIVGGFTLIAGTLAGIMAIWGIGMYYGITSVSQFTESCSELVAQSLSRGVMAKLNKSRKVKFQARKRRKIKVKDETTGKKTKIETVEKTGEKKEFGVGEIEKLSDEKFLKFQSKIELVIDAQVNKIANNIRMLRFCYGNDMHDTYALLSGHQAFITAHFFELYGRHFDEVMVMNEKTVLHRFSSDQVSLTTVEKGRDSVSLMFPTTYLPVRSLEGKMMTESENVMDSDQYQIARIHRTSKNGVVTIRHVLGNSLRNGIQREEQLTTPDGRKIRMQLDKYLVSVGSQGEDGDCSLPYVAIDRCTGDVKLVGFHFARLAEDSYVCPLYKKDLKYHQAIKANSGLALQCGLKNRGAWYPDCVSNAKPERRYPYDSRLVSEGTAHVSSFIPSKTNIIESPFQGNSELPPIKEIKGYPALLQPTIFDDGQEPVIVKPLANALQKIVSPPITVFPPDLLRLGREEPERVFRGFVPNVRKKFRMLSLEEALEQLSRDTSVGYDGKCDGFKTRKDMWKIDETTGKVTWVHPLLRAGVMKIFAAMRAGFMPRNVVEYCLKDEIREEIRVRLGKTRLFCVGGLYHLIATIMVMGDIVLFMKEHFGSSDVAIGVNPHGKDWTMLVRKILKFMNIGAGDFSNYDTSIVSEFAYLMYLCLREYTLWYIEDPMQDWFLYCMCMSSVAPVAVCKDEIYSMDWMNPSGNWLTGFFNSFVNCVIFNYYFWYVCQVNDLGDLTREEHLLTWFYGDDNFWSVSDHIKKYFNMQTIGAFIFEKFGMTYTTPSKEEVTKPFLELSEVDFLCRKFVKWNDDDTLYHAQLDEESISQMLLWLRSPKRGVTIAEQMSINVETALMEFYHYGPDKFTAEQALLFEYSKKCNIPWKAKSFEHYHRRFCDGVSFC